MKKRKSGAAKTLVPKRIKPQTIKHLLKEFGDGFNQCLGRIDGVVKTNSFTHAAMVTLQVDFQKLQDVINQMIDCYPGGDAGMGAIVGSHAVASSVVPFVRTRDIGMKVQYLQYGILDKLQQIYNNYRDDVPFPMVDLLRVFVDCRDTYDDVTRHLEFMEKQPAAEKVTAEKLSELNAKLKASRNQSSGASAATDETTSSFFGRCVIC